MTVDGETWQLGHRTEDGRWERHPVTAERPARGEATGRVLCMTCDEPVDYVAVSAAVLRRRLRWRRGRARAGRYAAGFVLVVLGLSAIVQLPTVILMATRGEWLVALLLLLFGVVFGGLAVAMVPYVRDRAVGLSDAEKVRLSSPSAVHEIRPLCAPASPMLGFNPRLPDG
ncbi:hypothetical protein [Actinoplanes sp. L3-i22]|uniref:hypothetical protein n=1 Tax=Actinoplanes sp. L3-i22 TaxID=2836373 RepID=UPI001C84EAB3|nr:hypothetical protein [Actinoplanes sp. L3-i22]